MKISNALHFTENHRFYMYRDFALGSLDYKMLNSVYQPMVGGFSVSLYLTLHLQLPSERTGYSSLEQQRKLFHTLGLELGDRGRKMVIEQSAKLEAVGLLQTIRKYIPDSEEYVYGYLLQAPLTPVEFFKNQHLILLLRDKIGKYPILSLKDELIAPEPDELLMMDTSEENVSVPFYDIFQLNTHVIDFELEQALFEAAPAKQQQSLAAQDSSIRYTDIIMRFPKGSFNRKYIEELKFYPDQIILINFVAKKFKLTLQELCRLLDEDNMFDNTGKLQEDVLQYAANLYYRQTKQRDESRERQLAKTETAAASSDETRIEDVVEISVEMEFYLEVPPIFQGKCDIHQYNMILRNEPYTLVLKRFFPKGTVPDRVLDLFEKIDRNYKLPEEVINVLIHYLHIYKESSWTKNYIETIVTDMLAKGISKYEQAVMYIREELRIRTQPRSSPTNTTRKATKSMKQKPSLPIVSSKPAARALTEKELEDFKQMARKLDGK